MKRWIAAIAFLPAIALGAEKKATPAPTATSHFEKGGRLQNNHATPEALAKARALADELEGVDGIMIVAHGDDVKVEGDVTSEADAEKVQKAIDRMNQVSPKSEGEVVILAGKSAHVIVPFAFR